ncbi:MAG TPA: hypothetical protein VFB06_19290 [Streptosporangiaceae bacterium]|nr:hypothetical protein [Streptosporangiaceae bacterium]
MFTRFARRVVRVLDEMRYAQYRQTVLLCSPDRFVMAPDRAPRDFAEFLFRTSGPLLREPTDDNRSHGELVR